jgi:methionyl-tRNA synthetase
MSDKTPKYITTTLPYVNAEPHVGTVLEFVQADCTARYFRLMGHEVFFNTGTDEHGQKIAQRADELGQSRQEYVDEYAAKFTPLRQTLNLSYDNFIRTTDAAHINAAQELWRRCDAAGDIYKKSYTGLYCVGCEVFYKEDELDENNHCLIHKKPVEEVEEENYFFRLSKYQDQLVKYLEDQTRTPTSWARTWTLDFAKRGLDDVSISRHVSRMDWGVPVPDDDQHVMYVWFDALTNYISTLGWPDESQTGNFHKFWVDGDTLQFAGKDQMRFQSLIWQAMLLSADLPQTDVIQYHGFINIDGQKISKSIGNVISPYEVVDRYGTDAARYILLRHMHPTDDSDLTWDKMDEWYTAGLVNGLGNLTARIMKMAETHLDGPIEKPAVAEFATEYTNALERYDFMAASDYVWAQVQKLDEKITETEPFRLVKTDKAAGLVVIKKLVHDLYLIGRMLYPIMPKANVTIKQAVLENKKPDNLFSRLEK